MRLFPRTARSRLLAAVMVGALAQGVMSVPQASADPLDDRRERVQDRVENADHALGESSRRMRRAMARLDSAQQAFDAAQAELARTQAQLEVARDRDQEMQLRLEQARERLAQAKEELVAGRRELSGQQEAVTTLVTSIYQEGDPQLQAFASMLKAQDTAELTWADEARDVVVRQETRAYDVLRASEVLLQVREEHVAEAEQEVEAKRQEAAAQLVRTRELTQQAREAKVSVARTVRSRRSAQRTAQVTRARDLRQLQQLKAEERKIKEMILARARRAARAARSARSSPSSRATDGLARSAGGFLSYPVAGGYVTSPYGMRTHPIYGYYSLHDGTDFGKGCGATLTAAAGGRVISRYYSSVYGNRLYVSVGNVNGKNLTIVYNHAAGYSVGVGQSVSRGQAIGSMGTTGWSTACHLHFTVLVNGQPVNPMNWL